MYMYRSRKLKDTVIPYIKYTALSTFVKFVWYFGLNIINLRQKVVKANSAGTDKVALSKV